jgi:hypothetical protein
MSSSDRAGLPEPIGYVQSRLPGLWFEMHPASVTPPDNTTGFILDGDRPRAATFRDGCWRNGRGDQLNVEFSTWGILERKARKRGTAEQDGPE